MSRFNRSAILLAIALGTSYSDAQELWAGPYQIGAHRCTVTPIRMAFDMQCPKNSRASGIYVYAPKVDLKGDVVGPPRFERSMSKSVVSVTFESADMKLGLWSSVPPIAKENNLQVLKLNR